MQDKKFLKTGEVAKLLGVPKRTINSWAENGILVPVQKTKAGYNLYTHQQIEELCQSAINLLASSENRAKSLKKWRRDAVGGWRFFPYIL